MADILICDDEPHITRAIGLRLRRAGHSVRACRDGAEALQEAKRSPPEILITDCQMPVMNGVELCLAVQADETLRDTAVVMLTAKAMELDEEIVRGHLGVVRLLPKPFSPSEVEEFVTELAKLRKTTTPAA